MTEIKLNKLVVSAETTQKLRTLQARTGLTPNLVSRIALSLSLEQQDQPNPLEYATDGMEFNAYTLFGALQGLLLSMVKENIAQKPVPNDQEFDDHIRAHISRGVDLIYPRVKTIQDIGNVIRLATQKT